MSKEVEELKEYLKIMKTIDFNKLGFVYRK